MQGRYVSVNIIDAGGEKTETKAWQIEVESKQYRIEVQLDSFMGKYFGRLAVDGDIVGRWTASILSGCVPPNLTFEVGGKLGRIKQKGRLFKSPVLYFDGKEIKPL